MIDRMVLISNGPGAAMYDPNVHYDVVAGCRGIASRVPCHWWVIADATGYQIGPRPLGRPNIWTRQNVASKLSERPDAKADAERFAGEAVWHAEEGPQPAMPEDLLPRWYAWSGTSGLGLALWLRPKRLDVFGMDLAGTQDAAGKDDPKNRSDIRWLDERRITAYLLDNLAAAGTYVERLTPAGVFAHG